MRQTVCTSFALMVLVTLVGCRSEPSIQGNWVASDGRPVELILDSGQATIRIQAFGQSADLTGNYSKDLNRLKIEQIKLPETLEGARTRLGGRALSELPDNIDATISFKNENEMVISGHKLIDGSYKRKN